MWMLLFVVSLSLLLIILLRTRIRMQWFSYALLNLILAAFILYFINLSGAWIHFRLPLNVVTILTVGVLGLPGLLLLVAIKLTLF